LQYEGQLIEWLKVGRLGAKVKGLRLNSLKVSGLGLKEKKMKGLRLVC